jgi:hypothetical protein
MNNDTGAIARWLRSLQAAAFVHRFGRQLTVDGGLNVHEPTTRE